MTVRVYEGDPNTCPVCGAPINSEPSPQGDAPCPKCGTLLWFQWVDEEVETHLAARGAYIERDIDGEVTAMRLVGDAYTDGAVQQIASIVGLKTLDVRETSISAAGVVRLGQLLPNTQILHGFPG